MTSTQIRQSFLNFFKSKQHTIVPSSSLMPDSPNLLFTNAGMNQFVPIFLGQTKCPYNPGRAADTQKCIRAGGKHNDLDDVGLDTYHHTFFEMLGNWSFGDYFKKEAIDWAWELVFKVWKFPAQRLYATVFCPYLGEPGWEKKWAVELEQVIALSMTSSDFIAPNPNASPFEVADQEAAMYWAKKFTAAGCDPKVHIIPGNKKDNFWMMGETGPCGPCTEIHVDLTPDGDTRGSLVNKGDARCIEIWNNVFIQFNANPDGTFVPLPAKHVDTGMGFERVTSIIQGTKGLTDFKTAKISNYETDIFRPIFDAIEKLSGKRYGSTLPKTGSTGDTEQEKIDVAFRVIADHIRTLSFAIADGIQPGIKGRNGVLRSIHKRMLRYASTIGIKDELVLKTQDALVDTLAATMGDVFPEVRVQANHIKAVLRQEADVFNRTLQRGLEIFEQEVRLEQQHRANEMIEHQKLKAQGQPGFDDAYLKRPEVSGETAFTLHDTYGFPLDLTELMARERGLSVDRGGYNKLMDEQKKRSQAAQKKTVIELADEEIAMQAPTIFHGFDDLELQCEVVGLDGDVLITKETPFYADMGGQVGDQGTVSFAGEMSRIVDTKKTKGAVFLHKLETALEVKKGDVVVLSVDAERRNAIQRHHTVTHLLHWALHEVASREASQKGSFVGPDKLTFDFNSAPLTPQQVADIEKLVNERILENAGVSWTEVLHNDVKDRKDVMQFFGDKYGDTVRVVQIGGEAGQLNGYSMELCGGTHVRATGEIGLFRIVSEAAVAAGVRRIEAVAGLTAYDLANQQLQLIKSIAGKINSPVHELDKKIESLLAQQKELEKQLKAAQQREASNAASELLERVQTVNGTPAIIHNVGGVDGDFLQSVADALKSQFKGVLVLGGSANGSVALVAAVSSDFTAKFQAGKIIQAIAPIVGGKGGGKPDNARGGGKDASKLDEALAKAKSLLG